MLTESHLVIIDRYADNGDISHCELINTKSGECVWSSFPEETIARGQKIVSPLPALTGKTDERNEQLDLPEDTLKRIGFIEKLYSADENNPARKSYEIHYRHGTFYYNPDEALYKWYHKSQVIEGAVSHSHLDITSLPQLYSTLQSFQVKFNLIIQ